MGEDVAQSLLCHCEADNNAKLGSGTGAFAQEAADSAILVIPIAGRSVVLTLRVWKAIDVRKGSCATDQRLSVAGIPSRGA